MPHVTLEYSDGLDQTHDLQALCETLYDALRVHTYVPRPETLKIRAFVCRYAVEASGHQAFVHATLKILPDRGAEEKQALSDTVLATLSAQLPHVGSLSVNVTELDLAYTKRVLP